jgi:hypothetical protein
MATDEQAKVAFRDYGLTELLGLEQVGDYWEVEALVDGKPAAAYLSDDGTITVREFPPEALEHSFGGLLGRGPS